MAALSAVIATLVMVFFIGVVVLTVIEYKRNREIKKDVRQRKK